TPHRRIAACRCAGGGERARTRPRRRQLAAHPEMARRKPRKRTGWFAKLLLVATAIGVARAEAAEAAEAGAEPSDPLGGQAAGQAAPNHCGAPATTPYHGSPWFEHDEAHAPIEPALQAALSPARLQAEEAQHPPP